MSSLNSVKHFLWYFIIYDIRLEHNRDQAARFLPEGSLPPSAVSGQEASQGLDIFSPLRGVFLYGSSNYSEHSGCLVTIMDSCDPELMEKGTNFYQASAMCQALRYLTWFSKEPCISIPNFPFYSPHNHSGHEKKVVVKYA